MLKIGITGGIGCGKSLVSAIFYSLGVPIYDADRKSKWLQNNNLSLKQSIKKEFGEESYSGEIFNSKYISSKVFNNPERLKILNDLVHPYVKQDTEDWLKNYTNRPYIIREAALLVETGMYKNLDKLIVVSCPMEMRIKNIAKRDPWRSKEEIKAIINSQMPESEKLKRADYTIENNEEILLIPQVLSLNEYFNKL
jgi:dephospho-CoA kinase